MPIVESTGYLALPESGSGPAVMVLPAWWGLNGFFRNLCRRFARNGYVAWAPDYYGKRYAATVREAYALKAKLNQKKVFADLLAAVGELRRMDRVTRKTISVVGFSMGARFALELTAGRPDAVSEAVVFYGTSIVDFSKAKASYQGHFAQYDEWFAASGVKRLGALLRKCGRDVDFHTYEGTRHWFFERNCRERYDSAQANLAWKRTLDFLEAHRR